jgi:diacylglycerol kinase family enzyme
MPENSAVAILNSRSGSSDTWKIARRLKSLAEELGVQCEIVLAKTPRHVVDAARRAARSDHRIVIAGGGDGTVNAVASELVGTEKQLGILPLGTFNYFARELGLPSDIEEAFRHCFRGITRTVTVGEVNGRVFLNNASVGLYPLILSIREQTYRRWGRNKFVAYWSVLKALFRSDTNLKLTIASNGSSRTVWTPLVFVARNSYQLEQFNVPGIRCVASDSLSVYVAKPKSKFKLLMSALRAFAGKLQPSFDFEMLCLSDFRIDSTRIRRTLAFDGERAKMLAPLEFEIRNGALLVAVAAAENKEGAA